MGDFDESKDSFCLGFANTWGNRLDPSTDTLSDIGDLLEWANQAGILSPRDRRELVSFARRRPSEADEFFRRSIEIRETVYRVLSVSAAGGVLKTSDVEELNRAQAELPRRHVRSGGACCRLCWPDGEKDIARVMWPVIQSAVDLVTSPELSRVRECAAPDCSWLFFDTGRGGRRRWCDMGTCGNRAKARRYYERHHGK